MKESAKHAVRQILITHLEQNHQRKTPERFAVLDTVCSFPSHFSMQQLATELDMKNFHVSRATLYNTINLLMKLRLVASFKLTEGVRYEVVYNNTSQCHQICTICGKVSAVKSPLIVNAVEQTHLKRFRKEGFTLSIYGVCSSCQAKITRQKNKNKS